MPETPDSPDHHDERAERALRDALALHAADLDPVALAPVRGRRRHGWVPVAAAAAAVALVAGVAWAGSGGDDDPRRTVADAPPTGPAGPATAGVSAAPLTMRAVSFRDVEVLVPASWTDARSAGPWCLVDRAPAPGPYVEQHTVNQAFPSIGCTDPVVDEPGFPAYAQDLWRPHLTLLDAGPDDLADGSYELGGWTRTVRTVGDVTVSLLTDRATASEAEQVIGSARTIDAADLSGCPPTSPIQQPGFQAPAGPGLDGSSPADHVAVCQYEVGRPDGPGLIGSHRLDGDDATALRDAILDGAPGGGPDNPSQCLPEFDQGTAIVLRFGTRELLGQEVYAYYESCVGNGFVDGTTARALTTAACSPLFVGRVAQHGGSSRPYDLCHP